jgi:hypothetical protein
MSRARALKVVCVALVAGQCAILGSAAGVPPAAAAATLPPSLIALEQKTAELQITTLRFSLQTSITVPKAEHQLASLLKLFGLDSKISGEVTISPAASSVTFDLFTLPLTLRTVGKVTYVYIAKLARYDHGRPWVELGPGGLGELFTVNGKPLAPSQPVKPQAQEPSLAEPPFTALEKQLAEAREVRELGPATLDGQPVTRFLAVLEPAQLKSEALASAARRSRVHNPPLPPTATLEVSLSPAGLPVQTVITASAGGLTTSATLEIPAVNFPLVIEAPPAAQTLSIAAYRKLERRAKARGRERRRERKKK